jgi:hypothetical protein
MDDDRAWLALESMDVLYPPRSGDSPLTQFARQLSNPLPYDHEETNLAEYKGLAEGWHGWSSAVAENQRIAGLIPLKMASTPKP